MDVNIVLKDEEVCILLAAAGWKHFYSFRHDGGEDDRVAYLIHEMVRRRVLALQDGELVLLEPYAEPIRALENSSAVLSVFIGETKKATIHVYLGPQLAGVTDSCCDKSSVRIALYSKKELLELLDDYTNGLEESDYPEELIPCQTEQENETCGLVMKLTEFDTDSMHREVKAWSFYRGKYRNYVAIHTEKSTEYYEQKNWNNALIIQELEKYMGGRKNDTD